SACHARCPASYQGLDVGLHYSNTGSESRFHAMSGTLCRWGILGTAHIARKNWKAIRNAGNSALVAVASRDRERARRFIEQCQADVPLYPGPAPCGNYQELLDRDDIDAVYIPLPTGIRKHWVLYTARAGNQVLDAKT